MIITSADVGQVSCSFSRPLFPTVAFLMNITVMSEGLQSSRRGLPNILDRQSQMDAVYFLLP